jgi:signal transduction histidine kinase
MEQVLINLLDNALAVTPPGARVTANVATVGGDLVFSVRDRGPGIPAAERARIFEPFHTTKTRGTGLGLALVRRIVDLHGGAIEVRDAPGGGAIFSIELPARRPDAHP